MKNNKTAAIIQALLAATLFGASAPLSKLLVGEIDPVPLASLLYLGSGIGALLLMGLQRLKYQGRPVEAKLSTQDLPWLLGAVAFGGIVAPIVLLVGLQSTPASTASLLLNFESAATAIIAGLFFREAIGRRIGIAIVLITAASIILTWVGNAWGFSLGAILILLAGILWGLDNNFTRQISAKDPLMIILIKGLGAGTFSLILSLILGKSFPSFAAIAAGLLIGILSYGLSIQLVILAMRQLGSARAYALFGAAPFVGMLISIILLRENPDLLIWLSLPLLLFGAWLMLSEDHAHSHQHEPLEHYHKHRHDDEHHQHTNPSFPPLVDGTHAHLHKHQALVHNHPHTPDLHHRHTHEQNEESAE